MANISKIKLPNVTAPYQLIDNTALHSDDIDTTVTSTSVEKVGSASAVKQAYDKGVEAYNHADTLFEQLGSFLTFKGTKETAEKIKTITSARVGDVWLETAGHSEWICIKAIDGTASASSWEELGIEINAASKTHTHNVTSNTGTASKVKTAGSVIAGSDASFTQGQDTFEAGSASTWAFTFSNDTTNCSLTISGSNGTAPSFTQGKDTFEGGKATSVTLPSFDSINVVTSVDESTSIPID